MAPVKNHCAAVFMAGDLVHAGLVKMDRGLGDPTADGRHVDPPLWQGYCTTYIMNSLPPITWLFILAIPIACIAWTVTHEEIFSEPRAFCKKQSLQGKTLLRRKFFYLFTCEYCFSFYVTALLLLITRYQLLYANWRGYLIAGFSLIWIANIYMSLFFLIRTDLKNDGLDSKIKESELEKCKELKRQQ